MSISIESSKFSTEVDFTTTIYPKPEIDEWNNTGNTEKRRFCKKRRKKVLKVENEKMEIQIIHLKRVTYHF